MDNLFLKLVTDIKYLFSFLIIITIFFHFVLAKFIRYDDKKWKRLEYVIIVIASFGLVSLSADLKNRIAKNHLENLNYRIKFTFENIYHTVKEIHPGYICRRFTKTEFSPSNLDQIQRDYDNACEWYKKEMQKLQAEIKDPFPELKLDAPPIFLSDDKIIIGSINYLKELYNSYEMSRLEAEEVKRKTSMSGFEEFILLVSPLTLCVALALGFTKITHEVSKMKKNNISIVDYFNPENFFKNNLAYSTHRNWFDFNLELFNKSEELKNIVKGKEITTWEQDATSLIFLKSQHLVISILRVCNEGIPEVGKILLRSLYENYISIKYIMKHKLGHKFMYYSIIATKNIFDIYEKHYPDSILLTSNEYLELKPKLEEAHGQIKDNYPDKNRWSDVDRRKIAEDLNELSSYDYIFKLGSAYVHCDSSAMQHYKDEKPGVSNFDNSPTEKGIDEVLHLTAESFRGIVNEWVSSFEIEPTDIFKKSIKDTTAS